MKRYYSFGFGAAGDPSAWSCLVVKWQAAGRTVADMVSQTGLTAKELEEMVNALAASGADAAIAMFALSRGIPTEDAKKAPVMSSVITSLQDALKEAGCSAMPSITMPTEQVTPTPQPTAAAGTVLDVATFRALQAALQAQAAQVSAATSTFQPFKITGTLSPQDQALLDRQRAALDAPTSAAASKLLPIAAGVLLAAVLLR